MTMQILGTVLLALSLALLPGGPLRAQEERTQDVEVELVIPDDALLIYDMHNAAVFSPDQYPPNAVFATRSRATAQQGVRTLEEEPPVVADLEVEGGLRTATYELEIGGEVIQLR